MLLGIGIRFEPSEKLVSAVEKNKVCCVHETILRHAVFSVNGTLVLICTILDSRI